MMIVNSEHIPAGSFKASKSEPVVYQAFLGTCVGVALFDKKARIGGLIHIILPEPPSESSVDFPEKYASTGLPMLISELRAMGASRKNIEATIAGGALVGPISNIDINLDIGGRSADIANAVLKANNINIIKSETGGFLMSTLNLDMKTGKTTIKPTWHENYATDKKEKKFIPPTISDIKNTVEDLQPIPQTALKILRMVDSSQYNIDDIVEELSTDQVLSAQTLKTCNSVMFSGTHRIDTLKNSVLLLGESYLLKSLIIAAVENYYNQTGSSSYSLCRGGLFFHAVSTAITAETIAELSGKVDPNLAHTAGLMHDIGKVVLDQHLSESYPRFFRNLKNKSAMEAEKKLIGLNHCDAGKYLAKNWRFSDALVEMVEFHHFPEQTKINKELVSIIFIADFLMSRFNTGVKLEEINEDRLNFALDTINASVSDLPKLVDAMPINLFNQKLLSETV